MLGEKSWDQMPLHSITQLSAGPGGWSHCIAAALPSPIHEGNVQMAQNSGTIGRDKHLSTLPPTDMVQVHWMAATLHRQLALPPHFVSESLACVVPTMCVLQGVQQHARQKR